jgi:hypothetical protein
MKMTRQMIHYIRDNAISVEAIVAETGVERQMFSEHISRSFNATEMLEICNYLHMDPYYFWNEQEAGETLADGRREG